MKFKFLFILIFLFGVFGLVKSSWAGDGSKIHWVSPNGGAAWSDCEKASDPGSNYCSLGAANSNAQAGETVYLKGGTYICSNVGNPYGYIGAINPAHSGIDSTHRIIFAAAEGEIPVFQNASGSTLKGIFFGDTPGPSLAHSWMKISGITFQNFNTGGYFKNSASYNEIANCIFKSDTGDSSTGAFLLTSLCPGGADMGCNPVHNWFHNNTFSKSRGGDSDCLEGADLFLICDAYGSFPGNNGECNYNTVEDNYFEYAGHATFESYGRFQILRNNVFHNEPWATAHGSCNYPASGYTNSSYNGKYGHRNIQTVDDFTTGRSSMNNLIEGNRIGYASTNPGNAGATNYEVSGPKQIIRYNFLYGAMNDGLYFKYGGGVVGQPGPNGGGGWGGVYNRVFNNTIYANGYGYPFYESCTYSNCPEDLAGISAACLNGNYGTFGNIIKNNLLYGNRSYSKWGADIVGRGAAPLTTGDALQ